MRNSHSRSHRYIDNHLIWIRIYTIILLIIMIMTRMRLLMLIRRRMRIMIRIMMTVVALVILTIITHLIAITKIRILVIGMINAIKNGNNKVSHDRRGIRIREHFGCHFGCQRPTRARGRASIKHLGPQRPAPRPGGGCGRDRSSRRAACRARFNSIRAYPCGIMTHALLPEILNLWNSLLSGSSKFLI